MTYPFTDNQSRQTWSNFPATAVPREGIALSDLDRRPAEGRYSGGPGVPLSGDGYQQTTDIQKADDYLNTRLGGQGADGFGALRDYFIAVYGQPSPTQPFMVQFGGHHLARNLTYNGDKVSQTPQFVGTEPVSFPVGRDDRRTVEGGGGGGLFGLMASLTADQRTSAEITWGPSTISSWGRARTPAPSPPSKASWCPA